jgi:predicted ribosomally synthesized peptide with nif11-like leader
MSIERAHELIRHALADPALRTAIVQAPTSEARQQVITAAGFGDVTPQDLQAAWSSMNQSMELTDQELELVSGGCILTTACIRARGLPDNCRELTTLRAFRDDYLKREPAGQAIVADYYATAPRIIAAINQDPLGPLVYADLYDRLVVRAVELIQAGHHQEALTYGLGIYGELKQRYLPAPN